MLNHTFITAYRKRTQRRRLVLTLGLRVPASNHDTGPKTVNKLYPQFITNLPLPAVKKTHRASNPANLVTQQILCSSGYFT